MNRVPEHRSGPVLPGQATSWFDKPFQLIWPTSQGQLTYSVYARLIDRLYADTRTLLLGYLVIVVPTLAIAIVENKPMLILQLVLVMLPIATYRIYSCNRYIEKPYLERYSYAYRDEARYFFGTLTVVLSFGLILFTVNTTATEHSRFIMAIVAASYMTGIMTRNAVSPRLVFVLTAVLALPTAFGLAALGTPIGWCAAALMTGMPVHMARLAHGGKQETVTALMQADEAERLANFDVLTELPNRHYVTGYLHNVLDSMGPREALCVLLLDIDKFKAINDSRGHPTGDALLIQAGRRIDDAARRIDPRALTARLGGDEFIVVTGGAGEASASAIIEAMQAPFELANATISTSCSIGVARHAPGDDAISLMKNADLALYAAKQGGRRGWRMYEASMEQKANRALVFEERFRRALAREELYVLYQPIVNLNSGVVDSFEGLARWEDEYLGRVSPMEFIPFAEETGLCDDLTSRLLTRACVEMAAFDGVSALCFNVSVAEFARPDRLIRNIERALEVSGLHPMRLWIEITEGVLIADFESVLATLATIRAMGVKISLDDFGSGYSSLSYLARLRGSIDAIKLDKSIVNDAMCNTQHEIIVRMVAQLAHEIGAKVVVEGIEDEHTAKRMKRLGATHAQGFHYGKPGALLAALVAKAAPPTTDRRSA